MAVLALVRFLARAAAIDALAGGAGLALAAVRGTFDAHGVGGALLLGATLLALFACYPVVTSRPAGWESWELTTRLHGQDPRWSRVSHAANGRYRYAVAFVAALPLAAAGIALRS